MLDKSLFAFVFCLLVASVMSNVRPMLSKDAKTSQAVVEGTQNVATYLALALGVFFLAAGSGKYAAKLAVAVFAAMMLAQTGAGSASGQWIDLAKMAVVMLALLMAAYREKSVRCFAVPMALYVLAAHLSQINRALTTMKSGAAGKGWTGAAALVAVAAIVCAIPAMSGMGSNGLKWFGECGSKGECMLFSALIILMVLPMVVGPIMDLTSMDKDSTPARVGAFVIDAAVAGMVIAFLAKTSKKDRGAYSMMGGIRSSWRNPTTSTFLGY